MQEALAATKDWFAEMGREMQQAEDQEAAEMFGKAALEKEEATGLVCVMLENVEDDSTLTPNRTTTRNPTPRRTPRRNLARCPPRKTKTSRGDDDDHPTTIGPPTA